MFAESGRTREGLQAMSSTFERWLTPRLPDGSNFGWVAETDGAIVAGLGMIIMDWPPRPIHPSNDRRAYILNVFVESEHRRKGIAEHLMNLAEERGRELGNRYAILHATKQGRLIYEHLGWMPTSEIAISWDGSRNSLS